jgi:hypothetical protein
MDFSHKISDKLTGRFDLMLYSTWRTLWCKRGMFNINIERMLKNNLRNYEFDSRGN